MAKKKVKEQQQYEVELNQDDTPGSATTGVDQTTKKVTASSEEQALTKATQGMSPQQTKSVTVKRKDNVGPATTPVGQQTIESKGKSKKTKSKIDPETMEMIEGLNYPYSVMLPASFREMVQKVTNRTKIPMREQNGKVYVRLENKDSMKKFMERLNTVRDKKTTTVLEGIKRSRR